MTRFASHLGAIGAAMILLLAPDTAAAQTGAQSGEAPTEQAQPLAETHWAGQVNWGDRETADAELTLYFRSDGVLVYSTGGASSDNGAWRQRNMLVTFDMSDASTVQVGRVRGDIMEGVAFNADGQQGTWTFHRMSAQAYGCPSNMVALRGTTASLTCICPQNVSSATVWGGPSSYTDDSDICTAAVHAGIIMASAGGTIAVTPREGQASYRGSTANGVTTLSYGSWVGSYTITGAKLEKAR